MKELNKRSIQEELIADEIKRVCQKSKRYKGPERSLKYQKSSHWLATLFWSVPSYSTRSTVEWSVLPPDLLRFTFFVCVCASTMGICSIVSLLSVFMFGGLYMVFYFEPWPDSLWRFCVWLWSSSIFSELLDTAGCGFHQKYTGLVFSTKQSWKRSWWNHNHCIEQPWSALTATSQPECTAALPRGIKCGESWESGWRSNSASIAHNTVCLINTYLVCIICDYHRKHLDDIVVRDWHTLWFHHSCLLFSNDATPCFQDSLYMIHRSDWSWNGVVKVSLLLLKLLSSPTNTYTHSQQTDRPLPPFLPHLWPMK